MGKPSIFACIVAGLLLLPSCSPRDFLTRRLAADLIVSTATFRAPEQLDLALGVISNQDFLSPTYVAFQHRGWISGAAAKCPPELARPCWDVTLTPSGVDAFQTLIANGDREKQLLRVPAARRELVAISGITKQGNSADVEFAWRWVPLNEVGAAIYSGAIHHSVVLFWNFDDGWRVVETAAHTSQPLDEALKSAEGAP